MCYGHSERADPLSPSLGGALSTTRRTAWRTSCAPIAHYRECSGGATVERCGLAHAKPGAALPPSRRIAFTAEPINSERANQPARGAMSDGSLAKKCSSTVFCGCDIALHDAYVVARTDARLCRYLYPMIRKALNYMNQKAPRGTRNR